MNRRRPWAGLAAGLLTTTLAGLAGGADVALAQATGRDTLGPRPGPFSTTVRPATPPRRSTAPSIDVDPAAAQPGANGPADPTDPSIEPSEEEIVRRPQFGRRPIVDGDPNFPPEPTQPRDGVLEPEEPAPSPDGIDPSQLDTRDPEDIAAFERPAAGFDPDLFSPALLSVEIEPILDRRPARLARFEPFAPTGITVRSFVVFPEVETSFVAFDNLFRSSSNVRRDIALDIRPQVRAVSNWRTHALEFRATGLTTFHNHFPSEDDRALTLEARGRLDVTRATNIEALTSYDRVQEARGSINAASRAGDRTEVETSKAAVTFNHRFNRLSVQLRGSLTETDYAPVDTGTGVIASNSERDNSLKEAAARATWLFKPEFGVFGEVALNERSYRAAPADGIRRDSTGDRLRTGLTFGSSSRTLRGEVAVGFARQRFEDDRLPGIDGIVLDANLAWRLSGLTSLLFTAKTDVSESTLAGSGGAISHSAGVELRHAFKRNLIGTAGLKLTRQDYEGIDLSERDVTALLGLEYFLNREVTLFGRYQHVDFESTDISRNYNTDEVRVGVRVRR